MIHPEVTQSGWLDVKIQELTLFLWPADCWLTIGRNVHRVGQNILGPYGLLGTATLSSIRPSSYSPSFIVHRWGAAGVGGPGGSCVQTSSEGHLPTLRLAPVSSRRFRFDLPLPEGALAQLNAPQLKRKRKLDHWALAIMERVQSVSLTDSCGTPL